MANDSITEDLIVKDSSRCVRMSLTEAQDDTCGVGSWLGAGYYSGPASRERSPLLGNIL